MGTRRQAIAPAPGEGFRAMMHRTMVGAGLAALLGLGLRRIVPLTTMRWASALLFVALGILALFRVEL